MNRWARDPALFVRETYEHGPDGLPVVIDPKQVEIIEAVRDYDRVAVRTGRGVGKTGCAAGMVVPWFLATHYPARVVTAAGSWNHLTEKLWPEIRLWGRHWLLRDAWEYQDQGMYHREDPDGWRVVAETSNKAENVEGHHSPNLLILIDEGKGMEDGIFAALLASLTSAGQGVQKIAAFSTPPLNGAGWFARASSSTDWKVVHVSGLDSARVSRSYIEEIKREYGEESPEYQSYVLGEIPEGASESVVQMRWFSNAQELDPNPLDTRQPVICCDVAREGDDLTTIGVVDHAKWSLVRFESDGRWGWFHHQDTMATAFRLVQAAKQHKARQIVLDAGAMGGGVVDRLRELQRQGQLPTGCQIVPVMFGSEARRPDRFRYRKDELWWTAREALKGEMIALPSDDEIRSWQCPRGSDVKIQTTSALYRYGDGRMVDKIEVMDKRKAGDERTKNLPTKSPDLAHSLILGVDYYLRGPAPDAPDEPWETGEEATGRVLKAEVQRLLKPKPVDPFRRPR